MDVWPSSVYCESAPSISRSVEDIVAPLSSDLRHRRIVRHHSLCIHFDLGRAQRCLLQGGLHRSPPSGTPLRPPSCARKSFPTCHHHHRFDPTRSEDAPSARRRRRLARRTRRVSCTRTASRSRSRCLREHSPSARWEVRLRTNLSSSAPRPSVHTRPRRLLHVRILIPLEQGN